MFEVVQIVTPTGKTDDVLKINNSSSSEISYTFGDILELDSEYTFSCWMRGETNTNTEVHISTKFDTFELTSEWTRVIFTATSTITTSKEVRFTIPVGATIYAYQGQLEVGNKATDFSTNPEDVVESITDVNEKVVVLQTNFNVQQGQIDALIKETTIDGGSIRDKFTEMEATIDGIRTSVGNVQTDVDGIESQLAEVKITADGVSSTVSASKDKWDKASIDAKSAQTIANQTAEKFSWLVKSGDSETNFILTDRVATLVAENINLKGLVTFSGLNSETQEKINGGEQANTVIKEWASDAVNGETFINGGYIQTHTITTAHLNVDEILAEDGTFLGIINAQDINADRITSGEIRANLLNVYGLVVRQKDTNIETFSVDNEGDVTVRGSVESYNYTSGESGWSIKASGDAEFNDVIVRGDLIGDAGGILDVAIDDVLRPVFWAGATYEQREYAPFIVYNDGSIKATKGEYSGIWTGDIQVGNISIIDPSSISGSDAVFTIKDGSNGIRRVEITDTNDSYFSQNINIRDDFYNNIIKLSKDGLVETVGKFSAVDTYSYSRLTPNSLELNDTSITGGNGIINLNSSDVYVSNGSGGGNLVVDNDISVSNKVNVGKEVNYGSNVSCVVSSKGIDFSFNVNVTVTFNSGGGSTIQNQSVRIGGYVIRPIDPTRTGYSFGGWFKDVEYQEEFDFNEDIVLEDITLYARWYVLPSAPTVTVQLPVIGTYEDESGDWEQGQQAKTPLVINASVNDGGTLTYKYNLSVYSMFDSSVIYENVFSDNNTNTISVDELNRYIANPSATALQHKYIKGTCTVTNTINGQTASTTVEISTF